MDSPINTAQESLAEEPPEDEVSPSIRGTLRERSKLTGDWLGSRSCLEMNTWSGDYRQPLPMLLLGASVAGLLFLLAGTVTAEKPFEFNLFGKNFTIDPPGNSGNRAGTGRC